MARPKKIGLDYFPFDVDMFDDEKMVCIAGEFGIKGEITAVKLLCAVYRNGYFLEWNEVVKLKLLRQLPGISAELLEQILNRLVRWGFFDASLFGSVKVLTSEGIQRRYFEAVKRRYPLDKLPYLLVNVNNNPINVNNNSINADKNPQIKRNKNKKSADADKKKPETKFPQSSTSSTDVIEEDLEGERKKPGLETEIARLRTDPPWRRAVCKKHSIEPTLLDGLISEFECHCVAEGKTEHADIKDCKAHFNSWFVKSRQLQAQASASKPSQGKAKGGAPLRIDVEMEQRRREWEERQARVVKFSDLAKSKGLDSNASILEILNHVSTAQS